LLERNRKNSMYWQPRPLSELNRDLSKRYGLPIEIDVRISGLAAIARALNGGDLLHAQIATVHLEIPDPPAAGKSARGVNETSDLVRRLKESRLLKADWNPAVHPRWPAGSPGGVGGEFAPADTANVDPSTDQTDTSLIPVAYDGNPSPTPAQTTIPIPFAFPRVMPFPQEVFPPPVVPPTTNPITIPRNPFPGRPKCVREWAAATEDCLDLWANGLLGKDPYRGMGKTVQECIMGRVTQDCGGNKYEA
jgi:hypothetical protein